ncbi:MAG: hypothetical protein ACT4P1_04165 [Sporichthyaceae bacterium]
MTISALAQAPAQADVEPTSAAQSEPISDVDMARVIANQEVVHPFAVAIAEVGGFLDGGATAGPDTGYSGLTVLPEDKGLRVYWHGPVPVAVTTIVAAARAAGVDVTVREAARSRLQFKEETKGLSSLHPDLRLAAAGINIESYSSSQDRSELRVQVTSALPGVPLLEPVVRGVLARITGITDVAVTFGPNIATSRQNDAPAWGGGGAFLSSENRCSTGFATTENSSGADMMLSAAHCDTRSAGNYLDRFDGTGAQLIAPGSNLSVNRHRDSMKVNPSGTGSGITDGYVYTGDYNASETAKVAGSARNFDNEVVMGSGSRSGEHYLQITDDELEDFQCPKSPYNCDSAVRAVRYTTLDIAVAKGDSGGVVYAERSDGRVTARGIIAAGVGEINCNLWTYDEIYGDDDGESCYTSMIYMPINPLLGYWGMTIKTKS